MKSNRAVFFLIFFLLAIVMMEMGFENKIQAAGGLCWDIRCKCHVPCGTDPPGYGKDKDIRDGDLDVLPPPPDPAEIARQKNIQEAVRLNKEGVECDQRKDYECAIKKYEEALKLNPYNETFKKNLQIGLGKRANQRGNDYFYQGQYDLAIRYYEESLRLYPNDPGGITKDNLRQAREAQAAKTAREAELARQKKWAAEREKISAMVSDLSKELESKPPLSSDTVDLTFLDPNKPITIDPRVVKGSQTPQEAAKTREREFKTGAEKQFALLSIKKGDYEKAIFYLMEARKTDPQNDDIKKSLALVFHLKETGQANRKAAPRAEALMDAFEHSQTDWQKSLDYLFEWSKASPHNLSVRDAYHFAEGMARGLKEYSGPVQFLSVPALNQTRSKAVQALIGKALEADMSGNYEAGIKYYKQALKLAPNDLGIRDCLNGAEGYLAAQQWKRSQTK